MRHALALVLALATMPCAVTAAQAGEPRRIAINDPALIETADARQRLKYLASCALAQGVVLVGVHGGASYEFPGAMGIAPQWAGRAMTRTERRWVSACILARTNAFGVPVLISMRADPAPVPDLVAGAGEIATHSLYEAGFYGDLFTEDASAFVCLPEDHASGIEARERRKRVCTHAAAPGATVTRCGFVVMGECPVGEAPQVGGEDWPEVIHVWLAGDDPR